jgi:predicted secreted protein
MLKKTLAALVVTALPLSAMTAVTHAATEPAKAEAQSPEVKKELKKLMEAYGSGSMSSKEYKARKEALLKGQGASQEAKAK